MAAPPLDGSWDYILRMYSITKYIASSFPLSVHAAPDMNAHLGVL